MVGGKVFTSATKTVEVICPTTIIVTKDTSRSILELYREEEDDEEKINVYQWMDFKTD